MPYNDPGMGDVHVDKPLSRIAIAYVQDPTNFVADRVFPIVPVKKQSDKYFVVPRGHWYRDEMKKRAPGTESAQRTHGMSSATYSCDTWALHEMLADQIRANYDSPLQAETEIVHGLTHSGMIKKEVEWSSAYFTTGLWTSELAGVASASPTAGTEFSRWDRDDSTPIEDIRTAIRTMLALTGFEPNKLTLGKAVYDALVDHPDVVARLNRGQTDGPAVVNRAALAALFEIDEILVMKAVYNSAAEGATDSYDFIGGKHALLTYSPKAPGLYVPSAGYTFGWTGLMGSGALGTRIKRIRNEDKEADKIEIQMSWDQKLTAADLGYMFYTAVS